MNAKQLEEAKIFSRDYKKYSATFAAAVAFALVHKLDDVLSPEDVWTVVLAKSTEYFLESFKCDPVLESFEFLRYAYFNEKNNMTPVTDDLLRCVRAIMENEAAVAQLLKEPVPRLQ